MPSRIASIFLGRRGTERHQFDAGDTKNGKVKKRTSFFLPRPKTSEGNPTKPASQRGNAVPDRPPKSLRSFRASTTNVPDLPDVPALPYELRSSPKLSELRSSPKLPEAQSSSKVPEFRSSSKVPGSRSSPNVRDVQSSPNVRDVPSLPIYESFTTGRHKSLKSHDRPRIDGSSSGRDHKLSRVATIADFQDLERRRRQNMRRCASAPRSNKPPEFDRAVELAKSYQAVIPSPRMMWEESEGEAKDDTTPQDGQKNDGSGRWWHAELPESSGRRTKSLVNLPKPPSEPTPSPASGASSTTAAETIDPNSSPTGNQRRSASSSLSQTKVNPSPSSTLSLNFKPAAPEQSEPTPTTGPAPAPGPVTVRRPDRRSCISQYSSVGMQICTELLADQLTTALSLHRQRRASDTLEDDDDDDGDSSEEQSTKKMQVLLMIEAYEGVLRKCRRETLSLESNSEANAASEEEAERRRRVGEAVPILEHWLDSLHALYDGAFVEGEADDARAGWW